MAATGTPTPNIGLRIPLGTDPASVDDINYNSNRIDTKLGAVGNTDVQTQINNINSGLNTMLKVQDFTSATISIAAGGYATLTIDLSIPTGYTAVGLVGVYCATHWAYPYRFYLSSSNKASVVVHNVSDSAKDTSATVCVLFVKNAYI